ILHSGRTRWRTPPGRHHIDEVIYFIAESNDLRSKGILGQQKTIPFKINPTLEIMSHLRPKIWVWQKRKGSRRRVRALYQGFTDCRSAIALSLRCKESPSVEEGDSSGNLR